MAGGGSRPRLRNLLILPPLPPRFARPNRTCSVRGISRKYIIRVPPGYSQDEAAPIVFSFHGWGSSAAFNEGYMGFNQVADSYVILAPPLPRPAP